MAGLAWNQSELKNLQTAASARAVADVTSRLEYAVYTRVGHDEINYVQVAKTMNKAMKLLATLILFS